MGYKYRPSISEHIKSHGALQVHIQSSTAKSDKICLTVYISLYALEMISLATVPSSTLERSTSLAEAKVTEVHRSP